MTKTSRCLVHSRHHDNTFVHTRHFREYSYKQNARVRTPCRQAAAATKHRSLQTKKCQRTHARCGISTRIKSTPQLPSSSNNLRPLRKRPKVPRNETIRLAIPKESLLLGKTVTTKAHHDHDHMIGVPRPRHHASTIVRQRKAAAILYDHHSPDKPLVLRNDRNEP